MTILRVALLQMAARGSDLAANLALGEATCRQAAAMGADIALFPEMWSHGMTFFGDPEDVDDLWRAPGTWQGHAPPRWIELSEERQRWAAQAIGVSSPFVEHFRTLARELGLAIAITYLERWPGAPRDTVSLIDRRGDIVLTYAKVHTCDFAIECCLTPGEGFPVAALDTAAGALQVGAMICFDREFPESARLLMIEGAELILVPNACTLRPFVLNELKVRAYENMVAVALANYPAPYLGTNGHSVAYHPIAFDNGMERDQLVVEAGEAEGVYLAQFDLDQLRAYRRLETLGAAFRRPQRYAALVDATVHEPFIRVSASSERYDPSRR